MQLTIVLELLQPTKRKEAVMFSNVHEVAQNRQAIANELKEGNTKLSSAHFKQSLLPSAVKNQNIREVKALYRLFEQSESEKENMTFKDNQPICFNNQNFSLDGHMISFPLYDEKVQRFTFPVKRTERLTLLNDYIKQGAKLGKASLFYRRHKWYFAITIKTTVNKHSHQHVMGVDIGLRQLAVASVMNEQGHEINRVFHNGKQVGFIRKKYRSLRRKLGEAKQPKLIKRLGDKEQRWMTDKNHQISRQLINLAVQEQVGVLVMEKLENIRQTARSLRRADRSLHSWAFYELQSFIEYKAKRAGVKVVYIDPKYTSQRCSSCGVVKKKQRKRNIYHCSCGNHVHADLNASRNIAQIYKEQQSA